ncbi:MAG: hypothetical protein A3H91_04250 [Gammaproteobacteria bacterium RIFCSPLOWO2_02_FULL_61_13]|nr:MAG: hypothetical protein A3H91_04250 [Gammaproteobacteria bacterium RIFCSPLOWO2_02_FULL_61_13]
MVSLAIHRIHSIRAGSAWASWRSLAQFVVPLLIAVLATPVGALCCKDEARAGAATEAVAALADHAAPWSAPDSHDGADEPCLEFELPHVAMPALAALSFVGNDEAVPASGHPRVGPRFFQSSTRIEPSHTEAVPRGSAPLYLLTSRFRA